MKEIIPFSEIDMNILGTQKYECDKVYRPLNYCTHISVEDGHLIFNALTREMVLLTNEEYNYAPSNPELISRWFYVPQDCNDKNLAIMLRTVATSLRKKPKHITKYTVLTTTDCNARCFYCFEDGWKRYHMTDEIAEKTADYIIRRCNGEKVLFHWFGGEPLYNTRPMDIICKRLKKENIPYHSFMFTNGYLLNDENVKKAKELWNIDEVMITLDGTEEVYNRCKNYIYNEGSAYKTVLDNIDLALDADITVRVRVNIDRHNADDAFLLADELIERFGGKKGFSVFVRPLFELDMKVSPVRSEAHRKEVFATEDRLVRKLFDSGCLYNTMIPRKLNLYHCMADCGFARMVLPDGRVGLCEHYLDSEIVGHIDNDVEDETVLKNWTEFCSEEPYCAKCKVYPICIRLKKCEIRRNCFPETKYKKERNLQFNMIKEYNLYKENKTESL